MGASSSKQSRVSHAPTSNLIEHSREATTSIPTPIDSLTASIKRLVEKNIYSDLTIVCCEDRYPVHRAIVCLRSTWFEEECKRFSQEQPVCQEMKLPQTIVLDDAAGPLVIAVMLTYLYTLEYKDDEEQLIFGVPETYSDLVWHEPDQKENSYQRSDGERSDDDHSDACSSEFDLVPDHDEVLGISTHRVGGSSSSRANLASDQDRQETESYQSEAAGKDPSYRPDPLQLHIQMYKTGLRYKIPCLAAHAFRKFAYRVQQNIAVGELLEAVGEAFDDEGWDDKTVTQLSVTEMQHSLVQAVRRRWNAIRKTEDFENVVVQNPEFGKELLRLL